MLCSKRAYIELTFRGAERAAGRALLPAFISDHGKEDVNESKRTLHCGNIDR